MKKGWIKSEENQYAASKRRGELLPEVGALLPPTKTDNRHAGAGWTQGVESLAVV